jgi:hypothetical protein
VIAGLWTEEAVRLALYSLPPVAVGLALSYLLAPKIPRERFAVVVHGLLLLCSAVLMWKAVSS